MSKKTQNFCCGVKNCPHVKFLEPYRQMMAELDAPTDWREENEIYAEDEEIRRAFNHEARRNQ